MSIINTPYFGGGGILPVPDYDRRQGLVNHLDHPEYFPSVGLLSEYIEYNGKILIMPDNGYLKILWNIQVPSSTNYAGGCGIYINGFGVHSFVLTLQKASNSTYRNYMDIIIPVKIEDRLNLMFNCGQTGEYTTASGWITFIPFANS